MPSITSPDDIPTLVDLHQEGKLTNPDEASQYGYDESLNARVSIWRGDITLLKSDMIVNAANKSLLGGGGVDGAIHRAAGPGLLRECKTLNGADTGETKFTKAYDLPSKWVAHTVGPVYGGATKSAGKLRSCYETSLQGCKDRKGGSIGFSSISTGIYGYPIVDATKIALETTRRFLEKDDTITRVIYVVFSEKDEMVYRSLAALYFPGPRTKTAKKVKTEHPVVKDTDKKIEPEDDPDAELVVPSSQQTIVGDESVEKSKSEVEEKENEEVKAETEKKEGASAVEPETTETSEAQEEVGKQTNESRQKDEKAKEDEADEWVKV